MDSNIVTGSAKMQCRTCLIVCAGKDSISVALLDSETTQTYATMLKAVTGVEAGNDDMLCANCRQRALDAYQFRLQARQSDAQLAGNTDAEQPLIAAKVEDFSDDMKFDGIETEHSDYEDNTYTAIIDKRNAETEESRLVERKIKSNQCSICYMIFNDAVSLVQHVRELHNTAIENKEGVSNKTTPNKLLTQVSNKIPVTLQTNRSPNAGRKTKIPQKNSDFQYPQTRKKFKTCNIPCDVADEELLKQLTDVKDVKSENVEEKKQLKERLRCGICFNLFDNEQRLDAHREQHTDVEVFKCDLCSRMYLKYSQFKRHFHTHHNELTGIVNAETTETILELHDKRIAEQILEHTCMTKMSDLDSENLVPTDASKHQPVKILAYIQVCGLCGVVNLSPEQLKQHNRTEHPDFHLRCYLCARICAHQRSRRSHMQLCKLRELPHECVICGARFTLKGELEKHTATLHKEPSKRVITKENSTCEHCSKKFRSRPLLKQHLRYCGPLEECVCEICNRKFDRKGRLSRHLKTHGRKTERLCATCGKIFATPFHLERHMRVHTGERPYKCDYCNKGFLYSHELRYHVMKHTGETSCKCNICSRTFVRPLSYRRHMMIHTGERPHRCNSCDAAFIQKTCLQAHMKKHIMINIEEKLTPKKPSKKSKSEWNHDGVKSHRDFDETTADIVTDTSNNHPGEKTREKKVSKRMKQP